MLIHQDQEDSELNNGTLVSVKYINQTLKKMLLCNVIDENEYGYGS